MSNCFTDSRDTFTWYLNALIYAVIAASTYACKSSCSHKAPICRPNSILCHVQNHSFPYLRVLHDKARKLLVVREADGIGSGSHFPVSRVINL